MTNPKTIHLSENDKKALRVGLRERDRERKRKDDLMSAVQYAIFAHRQKYPRKTIFEDIK